MRSKTFKKIVAAALVAALGATSIVPAPGAQAAVKAKKLTVKKKKITLYKGAAKAFSQATLKVTVKPKKAKVTYKVNKKKIATVSKKGVVKAKKAGKAKITVQSGSKKAVVTVTVKSVKKITSITPKKKEINLEKKGATAKINVTVKPAKATLKNANQFAYKTSKKAVATVNKSGKVTAKANTGSANITVTAQDGSKKKATVKVTVGASTGAITTGQAVTAQAVTTPAVATKAPSQVPASQTPASQTPSEEPTVAPTEKATEAPTEEPTVAPTEEPEETPDWEGPVKDMDLNLTIGDADFSIDEFVMEAFGDMISAVTGKSVKDIVSKYSAKTGAREYSEDVSVEKTATGEKATINTPDGEYELTVSESNGTATVTAVLDDEKFTMTAKDSTTSAGANEKATTFDVTLAIGGKTFEGAAIVSDEDGVQSLILVTNDLDDDIVMVNYDGKTAKFWLGGKGTIEDYNA